MREGNFPYFREQSNELQNNPCKDFQYFIKFLWWLPTNYWFLHYFFRKHFFCHLDFFDKHFIWILRSYHGTSDPDSKEFCTSNKKGMVENGGGVWQQLVPISSSPLKPMIICSHCTLLFPLVESCLLIVFSSYFMWSVNQYSKLLEYELLTQQYRYQLSLPRAYYNGSRVIVFIRNIIICYSSQLKRICRTSRVNYNLSFHLGTWHALQSSCRHLHKNLHLL